MPSKVVPVGMMPWPRNSSGQMLRPFLRRGGGCEREYEDYEYEEHVRRSISATSPVAAVAGEPRAVCAIRRDRESSCVPRPPAGWAAPAAALSTVESTPAAWSARAIGDAARSSVPDPGRRRARRSWPLRPRSCSRGASRERSTPEPTTGLQESWPTLSAQSTSSDATLGLGPFGWPRAPKCSRPSRAAIRRPSSA